MNGFLKFLLIAGVFVVPAVIANSFSKSLRLQDQVGRFYFVLFAVVVGVVIALFGGDPKLAIDLSGGVKLVYELKKDKNGNLPSAEVVDQLIGVVKKRLDPGNVKEITIRPFGQDKIEVIVPTPAQNASATQADDAREELERIKYLIGTSGALEFRITANPHKHQSIIDRATKLKDDDDVLNGPGADGKEVALARWVPIADTKKARDEFRPNGGYTMRTVRRLDNDVPQVLVAIDQFNVTGEYLANASSGLDSMGQPAVFFRFNADGALRFERLTQANTPANNNGQISHLAIILDDFMQSAPRINEVISESGQITGGFNNEQAAKDLAEILNAGGLPAALDKDPSQKVISATLGRETITSGVTSMVIATSVVIVFMLIYYRFAGLVANLALILNVLLIYAFMIIFNAAFSLAGLAGLALTVGMAVDANVLIYERIREELTRGSTLRMAIRNGFDRATVTIVDANVTTLITAVVLYMIGTDQIKGFAVTLTVGIVMNLFTAITCTRLMFDVAERNRWVSNLKFMQIMGNTNFDFIGKRQICYTVSLAFLTVGLIAAFIRGEELFSIDFTGGTSVTMVFDKPPQGGIAKVREEVEKKFPDATVNQEGESAAQLEGGTDFTVETAESNQDAVEAALTSSFPTELKRYRMTYGAPTVIGAAPAAASNSASPTAPITLPATTPAIVPATVVPPAGPALTPPVGTGSDLSTPVEGLAAADATTEFASFDEELGSSCQPAPAATAAAPAATAAPLPTSLPPSTIVPPTSGAPTSPLTVPALVPPTVPGAGVPAGPTIVSPTLPGVTAPATTPLPVSPPVSSFSDLQNAVGTPTVTTTPATTTDAPEVDRFAGGSRIELKLQPGISRPRLDELVKAAAEQSSPAVGYRLSPPESIVGKVKRLENWVLELNVPAPQAEALLKRLDTQVASTAFFSSSDLVRASVASGARTSAVWAMIVSLFLVMLYVWFRFQDLSFGFAAILALIHDVLFTVSCLALSYWLAPYFGFALVDPFKIDLTVVAALLTIIGYSLNDTIVIFDRIREVRGKSPMMTGEVINTCVNQTLSRTILTSLTVFMVVVILYFWGGAGIHRFAFAMVVGTLSGTYSTIYVASPFLLWLFRKQNAAAAAKGAAPAIG